MSLKKYQQKRNFKKTGEPKGVVKKSTKKLIFAIHKHYARNLHYDLRLEYKGVLRSWAVPKRPSVSGLKRLAVQVEDHPLEYAKFKGVIPEGQYGAGKVEIWDRGTWVPESMGKKKIVFELKGQQLKGRFALINFRGKNWLFFKMKG